MDRPVEADYSVLPLLRRFEITFHNFGRKPPGFIKNGIGVCLQHTSVTVLTVATYVIDAKHSDTSFSEKTFHFQL